MLKFGDRIKYGDKEGNFVSADDSTGEATVLFDGETLTSVVPSKDLSSGTRREDPEEVREGIVYLMKSVLLLESYKTEVHEGLIGKTSFVPDRGWLKQAEGTLIRSYPINQGELSYKNKKYVYAWVWSWDPECLYYEIKEA